MHRTHTVFCVYFPTFCLNEIKGIKVQWKWFNYLLIMFALCDNSKKISTDEIILKMAFQ